MKPVPIHIVCVWRTGGDYTAEYVNNLFNSIARNVDCEYTFTVLTNSSQELHPSIRVVPLVHDWPAWWSKIEIFTPKLCTKGRIWYFDLDTLIVNNITSMITDPRLQKDFYTLQDFMVDNRLASGVMTWMANSPAASKIYREFCKKPDTIITSCCTLGDQCWIGLTLESRHYLQQLFPQKFESFKLGCKSGHCVGTAGVICFHGVPRPHDAVRNSSTAWVRNYWK